MRIEHIALYVNDLETHAISSSDTLTLSPMTATTTQKPVFGPISCALKMEHVWKS